MYLSALVFFIILLVNCVVYRSDRKLINENKNIQYVKLYKALHREHLITFGGLLVAYVSGSLYFFFSVETAVAIDELENADALFFGWLFSLIW